VGEAVLQGSCVREAIEVERSGLEVGKPEDLDYPKELIDKFDGNPELRRLSTS
jgi:uncharacterized protein YdeI (YjbR/CyaY-like superfamily)